MNAKKELRIMRRKFMKDRGRDIILPRPDWLKDNDAMVRVYSMKDDILAHGEIHYAYIIQANNLLWSKADEIDYPAQIVYSLDPKCKDNTKFLAWAAEFLYNFKDKPLDNVPESLREFAECISNEHDCTRWSMRLKYRSRSLETEIVPTLVFRDHLFGNYLKKQLLPIIALPEPSPRIIILPKKYWSKGFLKYWNEK